MSDPVPLPPREEQDRRIAVSLLRQLGEFARHVGAAGVTDIMLNPDGKVWVHRDGWGKEMVGRMAPGAAEAFVGTVASTVRGAVTRENPILECELPGEPPFNGARIEAMIRPVVTAPAFAIRFHAARLHTLDDYVRDGIMTPHQRAVLRDAVERRLNVIISGSTRSGKTTLLNGFIAEISEVAPEHRLVLIEDTRELRCAAADAVPLRTADGVDHLRLLKVILRVGPDRPILGEMRGGEALTLLKAWDTDHPGGASTVHAKNARGVPRRMERMIQEVSMVPQHELIAEAVNLVVHISRTREAPGRRVQEIVALTGYAGGQYQFETVG